MLSKKSKNKLRKTVRRHKKSISGKINVPLDVTSEKDLATFKSILQKKPLTIIMVYATWCPHCHTMMPHFDKAAKSPKNTVSAVKINETMLPSVNNYLTNNGANKPLKVEGYPSIILINKKGEKVTDIEPIRNTERMQSIMEESGKLANEAGLTNTSNNAMKKNVNLNSLSLDQLSNINSNNNSNNRNNSNKKRENESMKNAMAPGSLPLSVSKNNLSPKLSPSKVLQDEANELASIESVVAPSPIAPPNTSDDIESISNQLSPNEKVGGGKRGGSLLEAMSRTTYTLAPAAALLATAAYVMKNNHHKKRQTKKNKNKKMKKRAL